jgi:sugar lactone lactonase YvrE
MWMVLVGMCTVLGMCASAAWASNTLYWGTDGAGTVAEADLSGGGAPSTFASGFGAPGGLAFDAAGNLYVAEFFADKVSKVTPAGVVTTFATGLDEPQGLAFDAAGNLYVANLGADTVSEVTPAGVVTTFASGLDEPIGLAFDTAGNLYVATSGADTVSKVTPAGVVTTFATGFHEPNGLAFDAAGNLYVANAEADTISKVTPAGVVTTFASGIANLVGLAFDTAGNLYAASEYKIDGITPAGAVSTFTEEGEKAQFIALAEVPVGTGPPALSGAGVVGQPLSCGTATWGPDPPGGLLFEQPTSTAVGWQLNGTAVPSASGSSFTPAQAGSYTCSSTATNQAGASTQTSAGLQVKAMALPTSPPPPPPPAPAITSTRQSASIWREGTRLAQISRGKRPPVGTTISFSLNEKATVRFTFTQRVSGREVGEKCVAQSEKNARRQACKRTVTAGMLSFTGQGATNKVVFQGRISHAKKLEPGRYTLVIAATNAAGESAPPTSLSFTIVS